MLEANSVEGSMRLHYASVRERLGMHDEAPKLPKPPEPDIVEFKVRDILTVSVNPLGGRVPEHLSEKARLLMAVEDRATIVRQVCAETGITLAEVIGKSRFKQVVAARHAIWVRMYMSGAYTPYRISQLFGADHSTLHHALHKKLRD